MFSSKNYLESRTPANGIGREPYIQLLTDEFRETESKGIKAFKFFFFFNRLIFKTTLILAAKHQISANLANFAYDPINFEFLKKAGVVDLFIELLDSEEEILVLHAISGISNICLGKIKNNLFLNSFGIKLTHFRSGNRSLFIR